MAVLSMLGEEPMHAYRMQQLIKERHKDDVVNVTQRNSVYQTVQRLVRDGLVVVESTSRPSNRPERTTYRVTPEGRATLREWLRTMLSTPAQEYPEFPAALAFLPSLSPDEVLEALATRVTRLGERLAALDADLAQGMTFLPRLFLVETELQRALAATELAYVRGLVDDLRAGRLGWPAPPTDEAPGLADLPPGIGAPARRALQAAGYPTLQLLAGVDEARLARLHGVGPKALRVLRAALAERGLGPG
jgi:DNA-binding PadR family transcriptional regulator